MESKLLKFVKRLAAAGSLAVTGIAVSACFNGLPDQAFNPMAPGQAAGIEGLWVDANGIHSSFHNGIFETRSADTNEKLAEGNYALRADNLVDIEMRSLVRGTVSRVTCSLATPASLMCTSDSGSQFTLTRHLS